MNGWTIRHNELRRFINDHGISGAGIFVELCTLPEKIPFYEKFGFDGDDGNRLNKMVFVK